MDFAKVEPFLCLWASPFKKLANHHPNTNLIQYSLFTIQYFQTSMREEL